MYETLAIINGYRIFRVKGTRGFYYVKLTEHCNQIFRTYKAAKAFAESN